MPSCHADASAAGSEVSAQRRCSCPGIGRTSIRRLSRAAGICDAAGTKLVPARYTSTGNLGRCRRSPSPVARRSSLRRSPWRSCSRRRISWPVGVGRELVLRRRVERGRSRALDPGRHIRGRRPGAESGAGVPARRGSDRGGRRRRGRRPAAGRLPPVAGLQDHRRDRAGRRDDRPCSGGLGRPRGPACRRRAGTRSLGGRRCRRRRAAPRPGPRARRRPPPGRPEHRHRGTTRRASRDRPDDGTEDHRLPPAARPYTSVDDLDAISGIGPAKIDSLRGLVIA